MSTWTKISPPNIRFDSDRVQALDYADSYFQPVTPATGPTVCGEIDYTFFEGNGLRESFEAAPAQFCVAELGLGTGANLAELFALWHQSSKRPARLDFLSFEAHPLSAAQIAEAAGIQGRSADVLVRALADDPTYPRPGISRYRLAPGFWLTLVLGDVNHTLNWMQEDLVDAWFLDGFAPARNQAMWSTQTLDHVYRMTRPGGRFATFTAASAVRRSLEASGFRVQKTPGFGPKRERLVGKKPGVEQQCGCVQSSPARVMIAGGGIAGFWAAHQARHAGLEVQVFDPAGWLNGPGSGVPVPSVDWRPTLDFGLSGQLAFTSFAWAARAYRQVFPDACLPGPVTPIEPRVMPAFDHWGWSRPTLAPSGWRHVDPLFEIFGTLSVDKRALSIEVDLVPEKLPTGAGDAASAILFATGGAEDGFSPTPSSRIRGQQTLFSSPSRRPQRPLKVGKSIGPAPDWGLFLGASFERDFEGHWSTPKDGDDQEAWAVLSQVTDLPDVDWHSRKQWSGLRCVGEKRWPNLRAHRAQGDIYSLNCLGSHGFTYAPLLAEQWVSALVGAPNVIDKAVLAKLLGSGEWRTNLS